MIMNYDRIILELLDRVATLEEEVRILKQNQNSRTENGVIPADIQEETMEEENQGIARFFEPAPSGNGRDTTKYILDGKRYGKNRLVLAIVQKYAYSYNCPTIGMLTAAFDRSLQGSLGVVRSLEDVKRNYSDYERRFFCQPNEIIHTADGDCVVCTQWGKYNIDNMVARAKQLGIEITVI